MVWPYMNETILSTTVVYDIPTYYIIFLYNGRTKI